MAPAPRQRSEPERPLFAVAVPSPLRQSFDYLPPTGIDPNTIQPGMRVRVPFGKSSRVGVVLGSSSGGEVASDKLRPIDELLDDKPCIPPDSLEVLKWAADYYLHGIGDVLQNALPVLLRKGRPAKLSGPQRWGLTEEGCGIDPVTLKRAPKQAAILSRLAQSSEGATAERLNEELEGWRPVLNGLIKKGWVEPLEEPAADLPEPVAPVTLTSEQHEAVQQIALAGKGFRPFLLEGVTGSGKTEVYLQAIRQVVEEGRQALVLIPEIGLTPQMVRRFRARFGESVAALHSGLSDGERLQAWLAAREGKAKVVIGTRSALFVPLARPGIIIVDEEHDLSFKQQEGFRYSARDLALVYARRYRVPVVLGSATPSLESLHNVNQGRYEQLQLPLRATGGTPPRLRLLDIRGRRLANGLSTELLEAIASRLGSNQQVLLFLNRRGYAPTVLCHSCGWVAGCGRCDAHMTYHCARGRLRCHHCGADQRIPQSCPQCGGSKIHPLGRGTERLEGILKESFPNTRIARIDRDTVRRKEALNEALESIRENRVDIMIGTQMLAKGHHFPNVTLVGILDADGGLFSLDFRAGERLAQLIVQVAGRAGRGKHPGEVIIQTYHPDHPLLRALIRHGYGSFARIALEERKEVELAPWASMALLRAEASDREQALTFLNEARQAADADDTTLIFGPIPAPMERRAGRYRAQLLLQNASRGRLQRLLGEWLPKVEKLKSARKVRWSVDVDPQEMV